MSQEKQTVALISLFASGFLAASKFAVGLMTGSLGILSEAVHSLLDLGATAITLTAVRISDRPPDRTHHFGHGKVESVAALAETGLLFLTCAWIVWEAGKRLLFEDVHVEVTWIAIAVIVASIVIDFNRARVLRRVARKYNSEALEADALHFSSDMLSSMVVLAGLGLTWAGYPWADALAAIGVSIFVCLAGWRLGRRTINTLMDAAPTGAYERIAGIANETDGVLALDRLRVRPGGATLFVDIDVLIARTLPFDRVTAIQNRLVADIRASFPEADVSVTARPVQLDDETIFDKVMLISRRRGLAVHHVTVQHIGERLSVSFDIEVDGQMPLGQAHELADALERSIAAELGSDVEVESHIEPLHVATLAGSDIPEDRRDAYLGALRRLAPDTRMLTDVHNVRARENEHGVFVTFHCRVEPSARVEEVHEAVDALEHAFRQEMPEVRRVIAHAEPLSATA
ncbi:cation-efflux pump [Microbaculum marinisediminis]|uniref:Cation-efflux pump n=1 Tax=Microbaculum marinisediminis TaxID=2931392 RepID=A0AAW5R719_9HYPH|nr:cation-efflux pump [Microbaculum sp. A6E488]MCT8974458.1 cation-efflux pump [Microbaculum sp. A6E488]